MENISINVADTLKAKFGQEIVDLEAGIDDFTGQQVIYAKLENGTKIMATVKVKVIRANGPTQKE